MISLYENGPSKSSNSGSLGSSENIVTVGSSYVTKRNGKLYLNRPKQSRRIDVASDLLTQTFGRKPKVRHRRSNSVESEPAKTPLIIGGVPFVPPLQQQHSAPLPQQPFMQLAPMMHPQIPYPPYPPYPPQPSCYATPPQQFVPAFQVYSPVQVIKPPADQTEHQPTQEDFEELKSADAHFRKIRVDLKWPAKDIKDGVELKPTSAIKTTQHICAGCGSLRSRKYHKENPIKQGESLQATYCRKCQKDDTSTSEPDSEVGPKKAWSKRAMKPESRKNNPHRGTTSNNFSNGLREEGYVIVDEELPSDDDSRYRGRAGKQTKEFRHRADDPKSCSHARVPSRSSMPTHSKRCRSDSDSQDERFHQFTQRQHPGRRRPHPHSRQCSLRSRYIQVPHQSKTHEISAQDYPRKIPVQFSDEDIKEPRNPRPRSLSKYRDDYQLDPGQDAFWSAQDVSNPFPVTVEEDYQDSAPRWRGSFKSPTNFFTESQSSGENGPTVGVTGLPSLVASQRCRAEQNRRDLSSETWKHSHVIEPQTNDEVVVFTERYVYRQLSKAVDENEEVERRQQEYLDKRMMDFKLGSESPRSERVKAAQYYTQDWSQTRQYDAEDQDDGDNSWSNLFLPTQIETTGEAARGRNYRRNVFEDSELGESEVSYRCPIDDRHRFARAPSPIWYARRPQSPHPTESYYDIGTSTRLTERERAYHAPEKRSQRTSRKAYVRDASSEEGFLFPSPQHSSSTSLIRSSHVAFDPHEKREHFARDHSRSSAREYEIANARNEIEIAHSARSELSRMTFDEDNRAHDAEHPLMRRIAFRDDSNQRSREQRLSRK